MNAQSKSDIEATRCNHNSQGVYPCGLSVEDIKYLKEHLEESRRWYWLMKTLKIWVTWLSAVLIGIYIIWDQLRKFAVWLKH